MSLYSIAIFLHVVAALVMFAAMGLEWISVYQLRQAGTVSQVREWLKPLGLVRRMGGLAALVLLVTGIYMGVTRWGEQAWMGLGLLGLVLMAALGAGVSGRRYATLARLIPAQDGPVPLSLVARLHDPVIRLSAWLRSGLGIGVIYLMTVKPGPAEAVAGFGGFALAGLAAAAMGGGRHKLPAAANPAEG